MLTNLIIKDFLFIESQNLHFENGFSVITGETGAGKTVLLKCLKFVLGERASPNIVRNSAKSASVTAEFNIDPEQLTEFFEEFAITPEDTLILRRTINLDGRSRALINDVPVSLVALKKLADEIVEFQSQHAQVKLQEKSFFRKVIDEYSRCSEDLKLLKSKYVHWKDSAEKLNKLRQKFDLLGRERDYLSHITDELEKLEPEPGEEDDLVARRAILVNSKKITDSIQGALSELSETGAVDKHLAQAQKLLVRSEYEGVEDEIEALDRALIEVNDIIAFLEEKLHDFEVGGDLETLEDRLHSIRGAARKFNCHPDELNQILEKSRVQLSELDLASSSIEETENEVKNAREEFHTLALKISNIRKKSALRLEKSVLEELAALKLEKTMFNILISELKEEHWSGSGIDEVDFLASTNPGSSLKPINNFASGGELSRFMLALKVSLLGTRSIPIVIFDEIDTGLSGAITDSVGIKMEKLSKVTQVIAISHQPQVAAKADHHIFVQKSQTNDDTSISFKVLSEAKRKEELARMLAGSKVTEQARAAAESLIKEKEHA